MDKDIATQELHLNIKHQNIQIKEFTTIGYEFEKGNYIFLLMFPINFLKDVKTETKVKSHKKRLTRIYTGKEILCKECKTKRFRSFGNKEEYGEIVVHKKNCPRMKKWLKRPEVRVTEEVRP